MSKEILMVVDAISNEKGVPRDVIFEAVEAALASASRKRFEHEEANVRVSIAEQRDPPLKLGDVVEQKIENAVFGRIAAQTAKQVIVQKVREAERAEVVRQYADREGELVRALPDERACSRAAGQG